MASMLGDRDGNYSISWKRLFAFPKGYDVTTRVALMAGPGINTRPGIVGMSRDRPRRGIPGIPASAEREAERERGGEGGRERQRDKNNRDDGERHRETKIERGRVLWIQTEYRRGD